MVVLGLLLGLVLIHQVALQQARAAFQQAEDRVVAVGSSLDPRVVAARARADADALLDNAHESLEAARRLLRADDLTLYRKMHYRLQREILKGGSSVNEEDLALFRRAVEHYEPVLRELDAAMPIEGARFDFDPELPTFEQLPYLNATEIFADLLAARAQIAMTEGRPSDAWQDVFAMLRLGVWSSQEMPILVSQLMADSAVGIAALQARALLAGGVPEAEEMSWVLAEAWRLELLPAFDVALEMERAEMVTWWLDDGARSRLVRWYPETSSWLLSRPLRPWLYWNLAAYTDAMTRLSDDCRKPGYQRPVVVGQVGKLEELYPLPRWATLARSLLSEGHFDACNKRDLTRVYLDQMELAFRLEDHRRRQGSYPDSLDAVEGISTLDPFSGEPYRYRRTEKGAVLYSVGINRIDNDGTPPPIGENRDWDRYAGDLVWPLGESTEG